MYLSFSQSFSVSLCPDYPYIHSYFLFFLAFHRISEHYGSQLCKLCVFHDNKFPCEAQLYDEGEQYDLHCGGVSLPDGTITPIRHPECTLCGFETQPTPRFYSWDHLVEHCKEKHLLCTVCRSSKIFFLDNKSISEHVKACHFLCEYCTVMDESGEDMERVLGFSTEKELQEHEQEHPPKEDPFPKAVEYPLVSLDFDDSNDTTVLIPALEAAKVPISVSTQQDLLGSELSFVENLCEISPSTSIPSSGYGASIDSPPKTKPTPFPEDIELCQLGVARVRNFSALHSSKVIYYFSPKSFLQ